MILYSICTGGVFYAVAKAARGKVDYFVNTVFNYPTLAECYKTAALDGINRLT